MFNKIVHVISLSAASLTVCFLVTAFIVFGSIWRLSYNNGSFFEQFFGTGSLSSQAANNFQSSVELTQQNLANNKVLDRLPITIFWALLGLVVYSLVEGLVNFIKSIYQFEREINYVHADRNALYKEIFTRIFLRVGFAIIWSAYTFLFFKYIASYTSACTHIAARNILSANGVLYTLIAFVLLAAGLHMHIVFLRLFLLKPRIFGEAELEKE